MGFRDWHTRDLCEWNVKWYAIFRLAKPKDGSWARLDWNEEVAELVEVERPRSIGPSNYEKLKQEST